MSRIVAYSPSDKYHSLNTDGCVVIQVLTTDEVATMRQGWGEYLNSVPEMKNPEFIDHLPNGNIEENQNSNFSFGQHGTLNFASSFYTNVAMVTRATVDVRMQRFFKQYIEHPRFPRETRDRYKLYQLIDRFALRPMQFTVKHQVFRYKSVPQLGMDELYGGWINLDTEDQTFYYVKNSHNDLNPDSRKNQYPNEDDRFRRYRTALTVPHGCMVLFNHALIQGEIDYGPMRYDSMRQYINWVISKSRHPAFPLTFFENQGLPRLPNGKIPSMYGNSALINHKGLLSQWGHSELKEYMNEFVIDDESDDEIYMPVKYCPSVAEHNTLYHIHPNYTGLFIPRMYPGPDRRDWPWAVDDDEDRTDYPDEDVDPNNPYVGDEEMPERQLMGNYEEGYIPTEEEEAYYANYGIPQDVEEDEDMPSFRLQIVQEPEPAEDIPIFTLNLVEDPHDPVWGPRGTWYDPIELDD